MRRLLCAAGAASLLATAAHAASANLGNGWQVNFPDGIVDVVVDSSTASEIIIQVSKDFVFPVENGLYPPILLDFVQTAPDANTAPRIVINDESITNLTGTTWTDFHWAVLNNGEVSFNVPLSAGVDVSPFATKVFSDPGNVFGDPAKATALDAFDGLVLNNGSFFPGLLGGSFVIDVDLGSNFPVSWTLKEFPTPEPGSALLLGLAAVLLRRRS